ncbi:MAG: FeoB-associated Cys-rich membrane protein [Eubacterium sp.]
MSIADIIIILLISAAVIGAVIYIKKHKGSCRCGGDCSSCPGCKKE